MDKRGLVTSRAISLRPALPGRPMQVPESAKEKNRMKRASTACIECRRIRTKVSIVCFLIPLLPGMSTLVTAWLCLTLLLTSAMTDIHVGNAEDVASLVISMNYQTNGAKYPQIRPVKTWGTTRNSCVNSWKRFGSASMPMFNISSIWLSPGRQSKKSELQFPIFCTRTRSLCRSLNTRERNMYDRVDILQCKSNGVFPSQRVIGQDLWQTTISILRKIP